MKTPTGQKDRIPQFCCVCLTTSRDYDTLTYRDGTARFHYCKRPTCRERYQRAATERAEAIQLEQQRRARAEQIIADVAAEAGPWTDEDAAFIAVRWTSHGYSGAYIVTREDIHRWFQQQQVPA